MTPKQAAAILLLATMKQGKSHPSTLDRMQMAEVLASRISDEKRAKILDFVAKIENPYLERLLKLTGAAAPTPTTTTAI
jgi:F0F1-type ATP synthase delta subunit